MYSGSVENTRGSFIRSRRQPGVLLLVVIAAALQLCSQTAVAQVEHQIAPPASYEMVFQGHAAMSEADLRKEAAAELEAFLQKGYRRADIDDAAFQMQQAYRKSGYAFAVVDYQIEEKKSGSLITFLISEGPRVIIRDIVPIGNQALSAEQINAYFQSERNLLFGPDELVFVRARVAAAVGEIRRTYASRGYLDAAVSEPEMVFSEDRRQVDLTIRIQEGVPYTIDRIEIRGDAIEGSQTDLEKIRRDLVGQPYFRRQKLLLQTRILEVCGNFGYPDAVVDIEDRAGDQKGPVVLVANLSSGPRVSIAAVDVRGNERTRASFIRNRIRLEPGDRYDLALQKASFRDLYRTGIFTKVDFELEITDDPAKRVLVVSIEATRAKELFFEPGWGSYEELRLRVGFQEKNLFGT